MREWSGKEKKKDAEKYTRKKYRSTEQVVLSILTNYDNSYFDNRNSRPLSNKGRLITYERVMNKSERLINEFTLDYEIKQNMKYTPSQLIKKIRGILKSATVQGSLLYNQTLTLTSSISDAKKLIKIKSQQREFRYSKYVSSNNVKKFLAILYTCLTSANFVTHNIGLERIAVETSSEKLKSTIVKILQ